MSRIRRKYRPNIDRSEEFRDDPGQFFHGHQKKKSGAGSGSATDPMFSDMGMVPGGKKLTDPFRMIAVFAATLKRLLTKYAPLPSHSANVAYSLQLVQAAKLLLESHEEGATFDDYEDTIDSLIERLLTYTNGCTPPFTYFGEHPYKDHVFGVWPNNYEMRNAINDGSLIRVTHPEQAPESYEGSLMMVTPTGTTALFFCDGKRADLVWEWNWSWDKS